jgi:hypothetical protein
LANGFDENIVKRLVSTNWWRTAAWTARSLIMLGLAMYSVKNP